jgi:hypothetical protein
VRQLDYFEINRIFSDAIAVFSIGSFFDQDRTLNVGDHCCRAPNAAHSAGSVQGAILMVIYTRRA